MLMTRVATAVIALAVFAGALFFLPQGGWALFLLLVLGLGGWEWSALAGYTRGARIAYTELHFTDTLWPDFDAAALELAIASYQERERRFGRTSEQVQAGRRVARISAG